MTDIDHINNESNLFFDLLSTISQEEFLKLYPQLPDDYFSKMEIDPFKTSKEEYELNILPSVQFIDMNNSDDPEDEKNKSKTSILIGITGSF